MRHADPVGSCLRYLRLILFALVVIIIMMSARAFADETVLAESTVGQGGLICDSTTEVVAFISSVEGGATAQDAIAGIDGCGILVRPARMRVIALGTYETAAFKYLLVRYDFLDLPDQPPQFGVGSRLKQDASL